ncbi:glycosyltransferase family 2 protein [Paractinoplanes durhamensis]|uniref:glycosyltransferase family 2 protein n=1 Tax=Paractinoplanes durhamensis TaxID=113563 RepID=UPI003642449C
MELTRPAVTVVVPTQTAEHWHTLVRAVASARSQTVQPAEVVVVVDHNPRLFRRVRRDLAGVTVLESDGLPGLSGARNTGAFHAETSLVAFLDDDTVADPRWLSHLIAQFTSPAVIGAGTDVTAEWQTARPGWLPEEFRWAAGTAPRGLQPAGTVLRRVPFRQAGGFTTGTDTDFYLRLTDLTGGHWAYAPDAVIRHLVPATGTTFGAFLRRCYEEGRGRVRTAALLPTTMPTSTRPASTLPAPALPMPARDEAPARHTRLPATRGGLLVPATAGPPPTRSGPPPAAAASAWVPLPEASAPRSAAKRPDACRAPCPPRAACRRP